MISEDTIQQVKASVVTYDIISNFIKLKKEGSDYKALCPFHDEKTASFSISPSKNMYKCFGCGKNGDGLTFLIEHEKMSFPEAIRYVANKNGITIEETATKKTVTKPIPRLEKLNSEFIEYFETKRKISNNTLLRFKVTESFEFMPKAQKSVRAICFNYYRNDELINIKFRASGKDFKMQKDAELIFYNLDSIKDEDTAYITEGEIDAMSLYEAGIYNVVSVPNGASVQGVQKLEYLDNCYKYFTNKTKVVLVVDKDVAGEKLKEELARRIGYDKCWVVSYPKDCKDANDVLVKYDKTALANIIEQAKKYPLYGEITMDDMFETVSDFYENGYPMGAAAGVSTDFDELLTFYPGQLTIVTGIPGSGKSEFVDWLMTALSKKHGWDWGICSFECDPPFHVTKLAEKFTDKSFAFRKNPEHRMDQEEFNYAIGMVDKYFHFMNLSLVDISIEGLIAKAEEFVVRYGIKGFLFDPWNCIEPKTEGADNTEIILQRLNKLISFLDKYKVHGFLVAHPTKLKKDLQSKKYEIPTLYSISGSAHFFNRTHNGMSIYRDFQTNEIGVYVQKVKFSWLGKLGSCAFVFDPYTRRYKPNLQNTSTTPF
jgi:twinkle protein